jgi:hypothetical protein
MCIAVSFFIKLISLEKDIERMNSIIHSKHDKIAIELLKIREKTDYLREDVLDKLNDLNHDLKQKNNFVIEEVNSVSEELFQSYLPSVEIAIEKLDGKIDKIKSEIIDSFQKERLELEKNKLLKKADTFKNLKAAFSVNGIVDKDDD